MTSHKPANEGQESIEELAKRELSAWYITMAAVYIFLLYMKIKERN
jgi:hypothetical protein